MLVLTRKPTEQVVIPGLDLTIIVLSVQNGRVRLGFVAPDSCDIYRDEVWRRLPPATTEDR